MLCRLVQKKRDKREKGKTKKTTAMSRLVAGAGRPEKNGRPHGNGRNSQTGDGYFSFGSKRPWSLHAGRGLFACLY